MCFELHVSGHIVSALLNGVLSELCQNKMVNYLNLFEVAKRLLTLIAIALWTWNVCCQ